MASKKQSHTVKFFCVFLYWVRVLLFLSLNIYFRLLFGLFRLILVWKDNLGLELVPALRSVWVFNVLPRSLAWLIICMIYFCPLWLCWFLLWLPATLEAAHTATCTLSSQISLIDSHYTRHYGHCQAKVDKHNYRCVEPECLNRRYWRECISRECHRCGTRCHCYGFRCSLESQGHSFVHIAFHLLNELCLPPCIIEKENIGGLYANNYEDDKLIQLCVHCHLEYSSIE